MDRIENITKAAYALFNERGFDRTPVSVIAKRAGVATGTINYHFNTKNNLLRVLNMMTMQHLLSDIRERTLVASDGLQAIHLFIDEFFAFLSSHGQEFALLMETWVPSDVSEDSDVSRNLDITIQTFNDRFDNLLETLIREGCADGSIHPVDARHARIGIQSVLTGSAMVSKRHGVPGNALRAAAFDFITARLTPPENNPKQDAHPLKQEFPLPTRLPRVHPPVDCMIDD